MYVSSVCCPRFDVADLQHAMARSSWSSSFRPYHLRNVIMLVQEIPTLATPKRCKDAKELKERFTEWSLKVAEYEHQLKAMDEAQKIFVVREMMPKDIKREFLTGPRKLDEIMEMLSTSLSNELMADDGPVPMDLGNVGTHDTKTTQSDSDTSNDMSHEDEGAIAGESYKAGKGTSKKGPNGLGCGIVEKGADGETSGRKKNGGKKGSKGSKPEWCGAKDKGGIGNNGKGKSKDRSETGYCCDCGEQRHIGMNCPYKCNEEDNQGSSWESEPEGQKAEELASLETPDDEGEWHRITRRRKAG